LRLANSDKLAADSRSLPQTKFASTCRISRSSMPCSRGAARTASQASICWSGSSPATMTTGGSLLYNASGNLSANTFTTAFPSACGRGGSGGWCEDTPAFPQAPQGFFTQFSPGLFAQPIVCQQVGIAEGEASRTLQALLGNQIGVVATPLYRLRYGQTH